MVMRRSVMEATCASRCLRWVVASDYTVRCFGLSVRETFRAAGESLRRIRAFEVHTN
jgi:hypothetical protein